MVTATSEEARFSTNQDPEAVRSILQLLEKLSDAIGENAHLQASLHTAFAAHLASSRGSMQELKDNLSSLKKQISAKSLPNEGSSTAVVPVGENLLLAKVLNRFLMYLDASDMSVTPRIVTDLVWEPQITEAFVDRLRPGMTVIDIGANMGYYSLLGGSYVGWDGRTAAPGRVYAFEPHPRMFEILSKNIQVNGLEHIVEAYPLAALDRKAEVALSHGENVPGRASLLNPLTDSTRANGRQRVMEKVRAQSIRIDDLVSGPVDIVKIDAEGSEPLVLDGMRGILKNSPNVALFIEFFEPLLRQTCDPREFLRELRALGFRMQWFTPWNTLEPFDEVAAGKYARFDLLLERGSVRQNSRSSSATQPDSRQLPGKLLQASDAAAAKANGATTAFAPDRFEVVRNAPVWMTLSERTMLYSLIVGLRPQRCVEIGTFHGGSAMIIVAALDDIGHGHLACVDPRPEIDPTHWDSIAHRATLFSASSPEILQEASLALGGPIEFAFVDGDHSTPGVIRDVKGLLPHLADEAVLLFHDAHNAEVIEGLDALLADPSNALRDCGMVSIERTGEATPNVFWGGLRLLRFSRHV